MTSPHSARELIEDHALKRVPDQDRHGWLDISWNTAGIVTTLAALFTGALATFIAGLKLGLLAGCIVAVIGGTLGWGVGHVAYKTGLSSTVMSRYYGFGLKGSVVGSVIFGFMIIGFIAVENILLYKGFLFYFATEDTLANRFMIYGILTITWILLTAYGFKSVTRVSSVMLIAFLAVLVYMMFDIILASGQSWREVLSFGTQLPPDALRDLGAMTPVSKFITCLNLLMGSAGALALIDADLGRYARSSADIGIAAYIGNFCLDILMVLIGGIILFAGMPALIDYYVNIVGLMPEQAGQVTFESTDRIAVAFILFGGVLGFFLMVAAQVKAQVLNTYSSSLSLANLFDAVFAWRPGRLFFVVLANLLSLLFLYGEILKWFYEFLVSLGVLTTCFGGIMLSDYFLVRPMLDQNRIDRYGMDNVNWAGVLSIFLAYGLAHFVLNSIIPVEFMTSLAVSFLVYPVLRIVVFRPKYHAPAQASAEAQSH